MMVKVGNMVIDHDDYHEPLSRTSKIAEMPPWTAVIAWGSSSVRWSTDAANAAHALSPKATLAMPE